MMIDFDLPEELIASHPCEKRDHCRMLVFERSTQKIYHKLFHEIHEFLDERYFVVLNEARVDPCRLYWASTSGKQNEIFFLTFLSGDEKSSSWEAFVSGKNLKPGVPYEIRPGVIFSLLGQREAGPCRIQLNISEAKLRKLLEKEGKVPLPPYILKRRKSSGEDPYLESDDEDYQTVYSQRPGAVAAPTAGLHFTSETFWEMEKKNIGKTFIHLAVGWGTFEPINETHLATRKLHPEHVEVSSEAAEKIIQAQRQEKNVLAVGTTSVRALETWGRDQNPQGFRGETDLLIMPGYEFRVTSSLLTNFHIPKSSLLLLVAAFLGNDGGATLQRLYHEAIREEYRFYSYGDCMLVL